MAIWNRLTAFITGGAVATAAADALAPELEPLKQTAWKNAPHKVLDPRAAAELYLSQIPSNIDEQDDAARSGIGSARFAALIELLKDYPGASELLLLWRRGIIGQAEVTLALRRQRVPDEWIAHVAQLKDDILDPGQLAAAIHRGLIPDPGLLKGEQPSGPRNVEAYPVYGIDALKESEGSGYDHDRLGVLVGLQGLPMGPHEAAQALFRGIITHGDYIAAFNESNSRNEWAAAVLEQSRQIPTARDFFENALRGYHEFDWALEQAKRHGMSEADATVIYQNQGRPMNVHAITQALSRGGVFKPEPGELTDPYLASIVEGNLKPAYYDLAMANRYTLPSAFAMRQLATSGVWDQAKTAQRLKDLGWPPEDAEEVATAWTGSTGTGGGTHVKKAQVQLWTQAHKSYLAFEADDAAAREALLLAAVAPGEIDEILAIWRAERDLIRKGLTPAQIKKAYAEPVLNPATGANWTHDDAIAELLKMGYSAEDATTFLEL